MQTAAGKIWSFFDLDGTLINKDSYLPFLIKWKYKNPKNLSLLLSLPVKFFSYFIQNRERFYIKEVFLTAFMKGAKRSDVNRFVKDFWKKFLMKHQNDAVVARLKWHFNNGHRVYIVSGSFDFYTKYLQKLWPLHGIISTRAEWKEDVLTGKIKGENCKGEEKLFRIETDLGINLKNIQYYAYTDSYSDLPLLQHAAFPIVVKSQKSWRFKRHANINFLNTY
jgi:HAD superfamily hydrolase (TIGR01490 family)